MNYKVTIYKKYTLQLKFSENVYIQGFLFTWKNLEFDNIGKKNLEIPGILTNFTCSGVKFRFDSKNLSYR